jgi:DNA-binding SARP family transcriptional activator/tetratricopeptide (TPR) repeat protein
VRRNGSDDLTDLSPSGPIGRVGIIVANACGSGHLGSKVGPARIRCPDRELSPSARLLLFGGAQLEGERGPITGRSAQRRRIALLALLAVPRRGVSRDKLIGYLWEEADTDRARRLLSEAVYVLRKSLGEDAVLAAGDELRLNEAVVGCDVVAFSGALEAREFAAATALYRGPFLDGFFVADASEFEQWVDGERDRLARGYAGAVRHLAEEAEAAGNPDAAADWWRLLTRHDPYTAAPTLGLMRALDAAGDRAAALQHATSQALRLARELDVEPDPQVAAFARTLREAPPGPERIPARPVALVAEAATLIAEPPAPVAEPSTVIAEPPALAGPEPAPAPSSSHSRAPPTTAQAGLRRLASRRYAAFSLPMLVALALGAVLISRKLPRAPPPAAPAESVGSYVAVFPFAVHGDAPQLGAAIAGLLASAMDAAGDLRTVDTHALMAAVGTERIAAVSPALAVRLADRFGATRFILGDVVETGSQVTVTAALYSANAPDERIERIVESAPGDSITALVGRLATGLLASLGDGPGYRLMRTAAHTTGSYAAFKAYYQGETEFQAGRYDRAADRFQRAVIDDPAFALAHYRLSVAAEWSFDFTLARSAARAALEASDRLTAKEALLLRAWLAFLEGRYEEAARQYARVLDTDPGNVEALSGHAEVLVHFNPVRGMAATDAEAGFARVLDLAPNYGEARFHALEFAARHRDLARFDSLFSQIDPRNGQRLAWQAVRASAWGSVTDQNRVLAALDTADELTIGIAAGRVAAQAHDFRAAGRIARLLTAPHRTREWRAGAHLLLAQLHVAGGDWAAAQRELDRAAPLERDWTVELSSLYLLHPTATASAEDLAAARERLLAWQPGTSTPSRTFFFAAHAEIHPVLRSYLLGLVSVRQGNADAASAHRMELLQLGRQRGPPGLVANALARSLQGHIALLNGAPADAIRHLREAEIEAAPELVALSPFYSRAHDRVVIAELSQAAGDTAAAALWYESLIDGFDYVYAAAAHDRLATLLERSDPDRAEAHRREQQRLTRR